MAAHHFWFTDVQFARLQPLLPNKPRGVPRVDDCRVISGIIHVLKNGLLWRDAPSVYGPHKTLYNRFIRWSKAGVFDRIFATLAALSEATGTVMIDATHLKAHRTAASLLKEGGVPRRIGRTKGGLNSKLHAVCDADGKPLILLLTDGQVSDYRGAANILPALPPADILIADKGYDSDWFRQALMELGIGPCIPGRNGRKKPVEYDEHTYKLSRFK